MLECSRFALLYMCCYTFVSFSVILDSRQCFSFSFQGRFYPPFALIPHFYPHLK